MYMRWTKKSKEIEYCWLYGKIIKIYYWLIKSDEEMRD